MNPKGILASLRPVETTLPDTNNLTWATRAREQLRQELIFSDVWLVGDTWVLEAAGTERTSCLLVPVVPDVRELPLPPEGDIF
jgi:hypothetical protein